MAAFESAVSVECLMPLVNSNKTAWDFCIVWKLGDDPSRFIEWRGCCCSGGNSQYIKVKEERGKQFVSKCRDVCIQHPIRTEACKALAKFPSSIPLYSGIHGEVVISKQPRWLHDADSSIVDVPFGTQVLVPVPGGLIELCSRKHVPEDQQMIDCIMAQYISIEQEAKTAHSFTQFHIGEPSNCPNFYDWLIKLPAVAHDPISSRKETTNDPSLQLPLALYKSNSFPSIEGSSTGSSFPNDLGSTHPFCNTSPRKSSKVYPLKRSRTLDSRTKREARYSFSVDIADQSAENEDGSEAKQRAERENYQSKNLITERNRRNRIRNGLYSLRSLVPNISKMDMSSIVSDAIEYIKELQKSVERCQDELRDKEEECNKCSKEKDATKLCWKQEGRGCEPSMKLTENRTNLVADDKGKRMVEIEVNQIDAKLFLVRIISTQRRGGFLRLMQAMDSLGVQVVDANVTTSNGLVLNLLTVEANRLEIQPKALKDLLAKLLR